MQLTHLAILATTLLAATARVQADQSNQISNLNTISSPVTFVPVKRGWASANFGSDVEEDESEDYSPYEGVGTLVKRGAATKGKGRGTFFTPDNDMCTGRTSSKKDFIVAMASADLGKRGDGAKNCGKCLEVKYKKKKIIVKVTDECPKPFCKSGQLDFTPAAWKKLERNMDKGIIQVTWKVLPNCNKWKKRG